mgnify:CR=1 FL=1
MDKNVKIGLGIAGTLTAIAVIYFGFTDKGKQKWSNLTGTKGTDASGNSLPRMPRTAEDAASAVKVAADGDTLIPRKPGFGSPFGSNGADGYKSKLNGAGVDVGVLRTKRKEGDTSDNPKYQCPAGYTLTKNTDGSYTCRANVS